MYSQHSVAALDQLNAKQQTPRCVEPTPPITKQRYAKLPVWATTTQILGVTFGNFGAAMQLVLPWLITLFVICTAMFYSFVGSSEAINQFIAEFAASPDPQTILTGVALVLAACFVGSNLAVKWHRHILLEKPTPVGNPFKLEAQSFRYFLLAVAIGFILVTLEIIQYVFATPRSGSLAVLAISIIVPFLVVLLTRISLKLPGIAVDRQDLRIKDTLTYSERSFWRILAVLFLLSIFSSVMMWLAQFILTIGAKIGTAGVVVGVSSTLLALATMWIIGITTLTVFYRYFIGHRAAGQ